MKSHLIIHQNDVQARQLDKSRKFESKNINSPSSSISNTSGNSPNKWKISYKTSSTKIIEEINLVNPKAKSPIKFLKKSTFINKAKIFKSPSGMNESSQCLSKILGDSQYEEKTYMNKRGNKDRVLSYDKYMKIYDRIQENAIDRK